MLASRTRLLYLFHIHTLTITPSPKPSTMWFMSLVLKPNSLPLNVVSTKSLIKIAFPRSLSLLIPFMQLKRSLTHPHIPFKSIQWPYSLNFDNSFFNTTTTLLNSGSVLVVSTGLSTKWSTKKPRPSIPLCFFLAKCYGTSARKTNVMIS